MKNKVVQGFQIRRAPNYRDFIIKIK